MKFRGIKTEKDIANEEFESFHKKKDLKEYVAHCGGDYEKILRQSHNYEVKNIGDTVEAGEPFIFEGNVYIANQTHTIQGHQTPGMDGLGSLYSVIAKEDESGVKEYALNMTVEPGDLVRRDDVVYRYIYHAATQIVADGWAPPFANFWEIAE